MRFDPVVHALADLEVEAEFVLEHGFLQMKQVAVGCAVRVASFSLHMEYPL